MMLYRTFGVAADTLSMPVQIAEAVGGVVTMVGLVLLNGVGRLEIAGITLEPKVEVGAEVDDIALMELF